MTALVILKEMGEEIDLRDPGRYFSPRDIKPGDIKAAEDLFRTGMRDLARSLRASRDHAEVEAFMYHINLPMSHSTHIVISHIFTPVSGVLDLSYLAIA